MPTPYISVSVTEISRTATQRGYHDYKDSVKFEYAENRCRLADQEIKTLEALLNKSFYMWFTVKEPVVEPGVADWHKKSVTYEVHYGYDSGD